MGQPARQVARSHWVEHLQEEHGAGQGYLVARSRHLRLEIKSSHIRLHKVVAQWLRTPRSMLRQHQLPRSATAVRRFVAPVVPLAYRALVLQAGRTRLLQV